ncbi:MAG: hypothetical protein JWN94_3522 [Betaproteobacteria bacterium]|nr:hypothetical protein [Betaproteobacteria bacterium]
MPLNLSCDQGGEIFIPFAKKKIAYMHDVMRRAKLGILHKIFLATDGAEIFLDSAVLSPGVFKDTIRITVAPSLAHVFLSTSSRRIFFADATGKAVSSVTIETNVGFISSLTLLGMSGSGQYAMVLSTDNDATTFQVSRFVLYVFKNGKLVDTQIFPMPFGRSLLLTKKAVMSYKGGKAVIPITHGIGVSNGFLIYDTAATPTLRYIELPLDPRVAFNLSSGIIAPPDLGTWGWFDTRLKGGDGNADSIFTSVDANDQTEEIAFNDSAAVAGDVRPKRNGRRPVLQMGTRDFKFHHRRS